MPGSVLCAARFPSISRAYCPGPPALPIIIFQSPVLPYDRVLTRPWARRATCADAWRGFLFPSVNAICSPSSKDGRARPLGTAPGDPLSFGELPEGVPSPPLFPRRLCNFHFLGASDGCRDILRVATCKGGNGRHQVEQSGNREFKSEPDRLLAQEEECLSS